MPFSPAARDVANSGNIPWRNRLLQKTHPFLKCPMHFGIFFLTMFYHLLFRQKKPSHNDFPSLMSALYINPI